jgi:uncharacterized RDD family membrane protein YckC
MSQSTPLEGQQYAGERLGLPEEGPGSVAGWGRRVAALFIDWFASLMVTRAVVSLTGWSGDTERILPLAVFLVQVTLFTALAGGSFGQLALRTAIVRVDRTRLNLLQALVRTLLICLVIPPLVFNRDNRGLHDLAAGTVAVRR